jgi:hypothetical protein
MVKTPSYGQNAHRLGKNATRSGHGVPCPTQTAVVWSKTGIVWEKSPSFGQNGHRMVKNAIVWSKRPSFGQNGKWSRKNNGATGKTTVGWTRHAVSLQERLALTKPTSLLTLFFF